MQPISSLKESATPGTPLLLFHAKLAGDVDYYWSTHRAQVGGRLFESRVLQHSQLEFRLNGSESAGVAQRFHFTLANADQALSGPTVAGLWKGAKLRVSFVLYDLAAGMAVSNEVPIFQGLISAPEEQTPLRLKLVAFDRFGAQRLALPPIRIQRECPWTFPRNLTEREEAVSGGARGTYSLFRRCGYSADLPGGVGNLNGGAPYTSCCYTRAACEERGMFDRDALLRPTRRFGGIEFVPASILVRAHGDRAAQFSQANPNEGKYNNPVPMIYGTAWYEPPVVFSRSDGNLLRTEVLLGVGPMAGVVKLFCNGVEIPRAITGQDMTGTGWFEEFATGERTGGFNPDFMAPSGAPEGDPYGSMAAVSVVTPLALTRSGATPRVQVLCQGLKLPQYGLDGSHTGESYTTNPAWVLLDILRRSGWDEDEIDLASFARSAVYCGEAVTAKDPYGNDVTVPRAECNLALLRRRPAPELLSGIQQGAGLHLRYNFAGRIECVAESTLALQQAEKPHGSNASEPIAGGWPAYEFGDGTDGRGGIVLDEAGLPSIRLWSQAAVDTPNRVSVEFQDSLNLYKHDSLTVIDAESASRAGYEINLALPAIGIGNRDQARRVANRFLRKAIEGDLFCELTTTIKGFYLRPNDLITITYPPHGLNRELFRVISVAPGLDHRRLRVVARKHRDEWYGGGGEAVAGRGDGGWRAENGGVPRPVLGTVVTASGKTEFAIEESLAERDDGSVAAWISAGFQEPEHPASSRMGAPFVSLQAVVFVSGGTLAGGRTLYYAVSGVGADGTEGELSLIVRAELPPGGLSCRVRLNGLRFPAGAAQMNVYRGENPRDLRRVAAGVAAAPMFEDSGLAATAVPAPDENFDHARFEVRFEYAPPMPVAGAGSETLTIGLSGLEDGELAGMTVVVTSGRGAGQERRITGNIGGALQVTPAWETIPDSSSEAGILETEWQVVCRSESSPAKFEVPNRQGLVVQIRAIGVSSAGMESPKAFAEVTRWAVSGGAQGGDSGVAAQPVFGVTCPGDGTVRTGGIAFPTLENTASIASGTLTLHYWSETEPHPGVPLSGGMPPGASLLMTASDLAVEVGGLITVNSEIMRVTAVNGPAQFEVARGACGTSAGTHPAGSAVIPLQRRTEVLAFSRSFFGSPVSGSYSHVTVLPGARLAAAQLFLTNSRGNSETAEVNFTGTIDGGLRTLHGGQISLQVSGNLAIQTDACAAFVVDRPYAVRDLFASVQQAPTGAAVVIDVKVNEASLGILTIPPGSTVSNTISGAGLPSLPAMARLSVDIVSLGQTFESSPGKDLTVTIRL